MFMERFGPSTIILLLVVNLGFQVSLFVQNQNKPVPADPPCKPPSSVPVAPVEPPEDFVIGEVNAENCTNPVLKHIVLQALSEEKDLLEAAVKIERDAFEKFGKNFNAIVSESHFGYVHWYSDNFCLVELSTRFVLIWQDD